MAGDSPNWIGAAFGIALLLALAGWWLYKAWQFYKSAAAYFAGRKAEWRRIIRRAEAEEVTGWRLWLALAESEAIATGLAIRALYWKIFGQRVFRDRLGRWPRVRYREPGRFVMTAPYTGPRRVQLCRGWKPPVLTGMALAALWYLFVYKPVPPGPNDLPMWFVLAGIAAFCAAPSVPLWWLARRNHRFQIRFEDGVMIWRGPNLRRYKVKAKEEPHLEVQQIHRWAAEEARKWAAWQRRNPTRSPPEPLFQTASELVVLAPGRRWMPVAEFCNDLGGERAELLKEAILKVRKIAIEEADMRELRQQQQRPRKAARPV
jgi:hypothetical protein